MRIILIILTTTSILVSAPTVDKNQNKVDSTQNEKVVTVHNQSKVNESNTSEDFKKWSYGNELLGAGHLWSFMASYRFSQSFLVNFGFSYILIPGKTYNADFFILPLTLSHLYGKNNHFFETQVGTLFAIPAEMQYRHADRTGHRASATSEPVVPIVAGGYRYQPSNNGWFFRISVYGVFGNDPLLNERKFRWWPGLSLGRVF